MKQIKNEIYGRNMGEASARMRLGCKGTYRERMFAIGRKRKLGMLFKNYTI